MPRPPTASAARSARPKVDRFPFAVGRRELRGAGRHDGGGLRFLAVTTKDRLHRLVDDLSPQQAGNALRLLNSRRDDPVVRRLDSAPEDDELSLREAHPFPSGAVLASYTPLQCEQSVRPIQAARHCDADSTAP